MNDRSVGIGTEAFVRYGFGEYFSPGILVSYEVLKGGQFPLSPQFPTDYLRLNAFSLAAVGWLYLAPGNVFSPYLYAGAGIDFYSRRDGLGRLFPNDELGESSSIFIPVGIGFTASISKNTSISFDVGYRSFDQQTDNVASGAADGFVTTKLGVIFSLGSNEDDDDDGDGLRNGKEKDLGLDPLNLDTDVDGSKDGDEVFKYKTNPLKADTDGDGLTDGDEIWRFRTNPNLADTDKDGLNDADEVSIYNTDPLNSDSDNDGLADGEEIRKHHTNPLKPDTDSDGLTDANEILRYKTDPLNPDTDSGGVNDGVEVKRGTNPRTREDDNAADSASAGKGVFSSLTEGIRFEENSARITPKSEASLVRLFGELSKTSSVNIEIRGYTDDRGGRAKNYELSAKRASAVKEWLRVRGIAQSRMTARGYGPENPIAPNTTEEGRQRNRRIEIIIK